jgi:hypothetical protein
LGFPNPLIGNLVRHILIILSILLLSSPVIGQSKETCYVVVDSSEEFNPTLLSNISVSIISQFLREVEPIPPEGVSTDSCLYQISVSKEQDTTFVTFKGKNLNSYGDSKLSGTDGFQQSLLKSLYRSLRDKRKLICEGYGELIEKCGSVVVQDIPKKVEPKVVEKKVTIPKVEPKVVVIPKKIAKRKSDMPSLKKLLDTKKCPDCDLSKENLSGADLNRANLSRANLSYTILRDADLYEANLSEANLSDANLSDAKLNGANLSDANLSDANLSDANLIRANLTKANLKGADLTGAHLYNAILIRANLRRANLSDADLSGANLRGADLKGANLSGANLINAILIDTTYLEMVKKKVQESFVQKTDQMVLYGKLVKDKRNPSKSVTKWFSYGNDKTDQKYVGETKNGFPNGKGTHTLPNGDKYIGEFWNGKRHGQGTIFWINGNEVVGEFQNNEYLDVIIYDSNGDEISRIVK